MRNITPPYLNMRLRISSKRNGGPDSAYWLVAALDAEPMAAAINSDTLTASDATATSTADSTVSRPPAARTSNIARATAFVAPVTTLMKRCLSWLTSTTWAGPWNPASAACAAASAANGSENRSSRPTRPPTGPRRATTVSPTTIDASSRTAMSGQITLATLPSRPFALSSAT